MRIAVFVVTLAATALSAQGPRPARQEIEHLAAFARLYGVVRYFYPGDAGVTVAWNRFAIHGVARVRRATDTATLEAALRDLFTPLGPGIEIVRNLPPAPPVGPADPTLIAWRYSGPGGMSVGPGPYTAGRTNRAAATPSAQVTGTALRNAHSDIDLGSGLKARVRLSLTETEARTPGPALGALTAAVAALSNSQGRSDPDVRLADVVVAWNVLRHFYPYWTEAAVDWDTRLQPQLALAASAGDRNTHRDVLRQLIADARDGHGNVADRAAAERRGLLPLQISMIEGRLVVTGSAVPEQVPVGSIVIALSGTPAADRFDEGVRLSSGTAQWRQTRALRDLLGCTPDVGVTVRLQWRAEPAREVVVPCSATQPASEPRPNAVAEPAPGIWYVDLTRVTSAQLKPAVATLASAKGIVFDMRGYPTDAGIVILRHLIEVPERAVWMHVPRIAGPFGQVESWQSVGWNLQPAMPYLSARRVFLTDGRAISYAESVMGYVRDRKLGTIIGSPTAGTNGNIVTFPTPGGFAITFTGMRVTGHDGRAQLHLVGIAPDIRLDPTLAGIRAGRDELLERALAQLQNRGPGAR